MLFAVYEERIFQQLHPLYVDLPASLQDIVSIGLPRSLVEIVRLPKSWIPLISAERAHGSLKYVNLVIIFLGYTFHRLHIQIR